MSINNFASIQVRLASPETILKWSHGEVTKPETINYRSQKAERDGLFCERIFGPTKDWECACGKYKKVRFKGVVCDRCGVEITKASVRRERMGHIHLAAPVAHIWYLRGIPSRMALLLDVTPKQLEEVVYFVSYIVTDPKESGLAYKQILSEREFRENQAIYGSTGFTAQTGAEAVLRLLQDVDLESEYQEVQDALEKAQGEKRKKLIKRLDTINAFRNSENLPEWMILTNIPVIPPDLRPMLQLDGGRFATSDLNDLYRRIINRNNRLKRLIRQAEFEQPDASIAAIDYHSGRKLNKALINRLATCEYITEYRNIFITGATGSGKTYMACAFGMEACKRYYSVRYVRLPDLLLDLQTARDNGTFATVLKKYTKPIVLIIDEWLLLKLTEAEARNLFELIHKRRKKSSTIFCSQFRESEWYQQICDGESTLADAIMDRISYDSYKIDIESVDPSKDLSMREVYGLDPAMAK